MSQVTNKFLKQMAAHTIKGNNTGSTGNPIDLTQAQVTAELNQFSSSLQGVVPASGGGTTNFLRADGTFAAVSAAIQAAYIREEQTSGTNGGTFTSGAWQTRVLNILTDPSSIVTLSSNQFTIGSGTYMIDASAPADFVNSHQARLQNITDSTTALTGTSSICGATAVEELTFSRVAGIFTISGTKTFELQHQCALTTPLVGFGHAAGFGTEVYTQINLIKIG